MRQQLHILKYNEGDIIIIGKTQYYIDSVISVDTLRFRRYKLKRVYNHTISKTIYIESNVLHKRVEEGKVQWIKQDNAC